MTDYTRNACAGLLLLAALLAAAPAEAQVVFRSASSATAPTGAPSFVNASSATMATSTIAFRAASSGSTTTSPVSISMPTGTLANDIMVAGVVVTPAVGGSAVTAINAPSGWNTIETNATLVQGLGTRIAVFWKRAATGETGPYSFTTTGGTSSGMAGGIISFSGMDALNPFIVDGINITTTTGSATTAPGLVNTVANAMLVTFHTRASSSTWVITTTNKAFDVMSEAAAGNNGVSIVGGYQPIASGNSPSRTGTATGGDAERLMGYSALFRPATLITLSAPATLAAQDVMIASMSMRGSSVAGMNIEAPAGWTLVDRQDGAGDQHATFTSLFVYQKAATAGDVGASYTFVASGGIDGVGAIAAYRNVDNGQPVGAHNGVPTEGSPVGSGTSPANSITHTTPAITTGVPNTRLVASFAVSNAMDWTTAAGLTARAGVKQPTAANDVGEALSIQDAAQAAIGSSGNFTASTSSQTDKGAAHILELRPRCALSIGKPSSPAVVSGDLMIASISVRESTATVASAPAGWTLLGGAPTSNTDPGNTLSLYTYYKVYAGEAGPYVWTFDTCNYAAGGIQAFSGVDTAVANNGINVSAGQATGTGSSMLNTHPAPQVTPTVANTMLVYAFSFRSASTWTPSSSGTMTEGFDTAIPTPDTQVGLSIAGYREAGPAAANTTTTARSATATGFAETGVTFTLALAPFVSGPTPGKFDAFESSTAAGSTSGKIYTKLVGTPFSVDIVALTSGGALLTGFTGTDANVSVDLVTGSTGGANCPGGTITSISSTQTVTPTSGRGTTANFTLDSTTTAYRDVRVRVRYPTGIPTLTSCSVDNFAIRPPGFSSVTSNMTNAGTTGTPVAKAGAAFSITAVAGAGYDGTPTIDNTKVVAHAGAVQNGTVGGSFGAASAGTGTATGSSFTYSEVGSFTIAANGVVDTSYTAVDQSADCTDDFSTTLVGGKYGCKIGNASTTSTIGRFQPDHFDVDVTTTPPVFAAFCSTGQFTYIGQAFNYGTQPRIYVSAKNSANAVTKNYTGTWWKITNASLTGRSYTALSGTLDPSGLPSTTVDPNIFDNGDGTTTLTFSSGTGLLFTRTTPVAPFNAEISLAINVIDADSPAVVYAGNPARFGQATAGNGISFTGGKSMRFGKLAIGNRSGSQLAPLTMPVETQYWGFTNPPTNTVLGFITNTNDSCTTIASGNVAMPTLSYTGNLGPSPNCKTAISGAGAFSAGRSTWQLAAPGNANSGSVGLTVNLGASASGNICTSVGAAPGTAATANRPYLQGNWTGAAYDQNPSGRATFGVYPGAEEVIYMRENF